MKKPLPRIGLFGLNTEAISLRVPKRDTHVVSHEVLFEDAVTKLKDRPLFVGFALPRQRFLFASGVACFLVGVLFIQAFLMQIVHGAWYRARADQNRIRRETLVAQRGIIRDRHGIVLAENIPSFELEVTPRLLPRESDARDELLARIGREINVSLSELQAAIAASTNVDERVTLVRDLPYARAIAVSVLIGADPSLHVVHGTKRRYPFSETVPSLSHVLGYSGPISREELEQRRASYRQTDTIGKTGVEASYESRLRGTAGERLMEVDAKNRVTSLIGHTPPEDGADLPLTIDLRLQRVAQDALERGMLAAHVRRGAVVVMDPRDGALRALVSMPAYENTFFAGSVSSTYYANLLQNEDRPLVPRAFAGVYPAGSTIKPVIATAGLSERVINNHTSFDSVGGIRIGSSFFPDWKPGGHGITDVRKAIAWSVNTFFYAVGGGHDTFIGLGVDRLTGWMRRFGLGSVTGLDLLGESAGFVPSREWKERTKHERWYVGDTYNLSIGQGDLLVTPLQVARFTAELANGGKKITPHVFDEDRASGVVSREPGRQIRDERQAMRVDNPSVLRTVQLGMRDTILYGSGRALASFPIPIAGKTGTAQWRNDRPNHAWFTAYAPFENPELVVTVLIEEGGEGSSVALPVAREIFEAWRKIP